MALNGLAASMAHALLITACRTLVADGNRLDRLGQKIGVARASRSMLVAARRAMSFMMSRAVVLSTALRPRLLKRTMVIAALPARTREIQRALVHPVVEPHDFELQRGRQRPAHAVRDDYLVKVADHHTERQPQHAVEYERLGDPQNLAPAGGAVAAAGRVESSILSRASRTRPGRPRRGCGRCRCPASSLPYRAIACTISALGGLIVVIGVVLIVISLAPGVALERLHGRPSGSRLSFENVVRPFGRVKV